MLWRAGNCSPSPSSSLRAKPPRRSEQWLRQQKPGDELHLRVRRTDGEADVNFHLGETTETFYDVAEDGHATVKARHIRDGLLHGVTSAAMHTAR